MINAVRFQSTRPVRGATRRCRSRVPGGRNFNPRAPCGARRPGGVWRCKNGIFQSTRPVRGATRMDTALLAENDISIHAPRAGRDDAHHERCVKLIDISIHAPRAGRDVLPPHFSVAAWYFNPRAPCGARHQRPDRPAVSSYFNPRAPCGARHPKLCSKVFLFRFQSTRPVRGATFR